MINFWHHKLTLKVRFWPFLTLVAEVNWRPRTFLWPFLLTFGLAYSPLNSAKLCCSSEGTLPCIYLHGLEYITKLCLKYFRLDSRTLFVIVKLSSSAVFSRKPAYQQGQSSQFGPAWLYWLKWISSFSAVTNNHTQNIYHPYFHWYFYQNTSVCMH